MGSETGPGTFDLWAKGTPPTDVPRFLGHRRVIPGVQDSVWSLAEKERVPEVERLGQQAEARKKQHTCW